MEKLKMESVNLTEQNIEKIGKLFPNVITETKDENGKLKKSINFGLLQQVLSEDLVEGDESYEFTWVGKKQSIIEGNKPIRKTLRPCVEESKSWDTTENLYIEGDNLEVLKLLQNSYLNSIKMICIDPPYNTGKDFVYRDNFDVNKEDYEEELGLYDDEENRLFQNTESNGRFHSDWCSMMYPRLQLSRNLLDEDGIIVITIDDNEVKNLKNICDEVFGESNFVANVIWQHSIQPKGYLGKFSVHHNHILIYSKSSKFQLGSLERTDEHNKSYSNPDNDPKGLWRTGDVRNALYRPNLIYDIVSPKGNIISPPPNGWRWSKETLGNKISTGEIFFNKDETKIIRKIYLSTVEGRVAETILFGKEVGTTRDAVGEIKELFNNDTPFDTPKPTNLIKYLITISNPQKDSIILDFFSGSSTTAHAVMEQNSKDEGNLIFIMVQLPENTNENSEAFKLGYRNICEIGKERIRRAGEKIKKESGLMGQNLDIGFRVLKLDDTNMKDVYYGSGEYTQQMLLGLESNIKEDRTDLDLLYGVMLEWGVPLSLPHKQEKMGGKTVHFVNGSDLVACFDENINETVIRDIAKQKPLRVVFRDSSFSNSPDKINVSEIFKTISPETTIKVI